MILKLEKAYRHSYAREFGRNDKNWYLDAYYLCVKVKRENPEWDSWEHVCACTLHIHYNGRANMYGHHWTLSGFSDEMDKLMAEEIGDSWKSYATKEEMMKDLEKIVARKKPAYYRNNVRYEYELA